MEMCYDGTMVMPSNYVVMDEAEMMYVEGGFSISISKAVFKYTVTAAVVTGCIALGGGLSVAGLRSVLGSMSLKQKFIAVLVKGIGKLGIATGNALASTFASGLLGCTAGDFMGNVFTKYIDGLDGKKDDKYKRKLW